MNRHFETTLDLGRAGMGHLHLGDYLAAQRHSQECLEWARSGGWHREQALALLGLGCVALAQGQIARAEVDLLEGTALLRQLGYRGELGWALGALALARLSLGDRQSARACLAEGLHITEQTRLYLAASTCLPAAARLLVQLEKPEAALEVYTAATSLPIVSNSSWVEQVAGRVVLAAAAALSPEAAAAARKRGQELGPYPAAGRALGRFFNAGGS
jgi:tetratricopeptide (TPR) repeat protein